MERLAPRVRVVWIALAAVPAAILVGAVALLASVPTGRAPAALLPVAAGLAVPSATVAAVLARRHYGVWRFELRDDAVYVERGVFTRVSVVVPYVRVQHVDSRRGPLERAVGLATVVVYTAGARSADVAIPGLAPARARELRERLRRLAVESEGAGAA